MKIWIVNQYAIPPSQIGLTRHYMLARELIERGHEVMLIASGFDHVTRKEMRLSPGERWKHEVVDGVPFLWLKTPPYKGNSVSRIWNMLVYSTRIYRGQGMKQIPSPDLIVGSSPHLLGALAAEKIASRRKVPFVLEVRDLWPQSLVDLGGFSPGHPLVRVLKRVEHHLYHRADQIITLLPGAVKYIADKRSSLDNISWIPNGADLSAAPEPQEPDPSELMTVMYAGTHGFANGLTLLLDAAYLLQDEGWGNRVRFRLVGDGPNKAALIQEADEMGLKNVIFDDPKPKSEIFHTMLEADAFLMILKDSPVFRWGVSPNKLFDYLLCARPILYCVNSPNNPVEDAGAGFTIRSGDARDLADHIKQLVEMTPEERREMGLRGRHYVEQNHSLTYLADRFEETLYQAVINDTKIEEKVSVVEEPVH